MDGNNLTITALKALGLLLMIIQWSIVIRALLSWFPISKENMILRIVYQITEPILTPIRRLIENTSFGRNSMIDLSPMIAILILWSISSFLQGL